MSTSVLRFGAVSWLILLIGGCTSSYFSIRDAASKPELSSQQIIGRPRAEVETQFGKPAQTATSSGQVTCKYAYKSRKPYPAWTFDGVFWPFLKETICFPFFVILDVFERDCFQATVVYNDSMIAVSDFRQLVDCKSRRK